MSSESSFPPGAIPLESLLSNTGWLRKLARHLLDDPHAADDVVQDVVVEALEQSEGRIQNWPGWLRQVLRRAASRRRRRDRLRRQHERAAADGRRDAAAPAEQVIAKAALQRRVVGVVLEMNEPYRTAILLRFFENLRPKQVAARLNVPIDTVYSRSGRHGRASVPGDGAGDVGGTTTTFHRWVVGAERDHRDDRR